jgi:putrescine aminotransferase
MPSLRSHPDVQAYARHVSPGLVRLLGVLGYGRLFVEARGSSLFDHEGRAYLDALAGFGAVNIGHSHPALLARLERALDEGLPLGGRRSGHADALAAALCERAGAPFGEVVLASGGAEAVEIAIKIARAATGQPGVICCDHGYHGLNAASLSLASDPRMRRPFEPLLGDIKLVPFGNTEALGGALASGQIAAFVVEPVQCEGGVVLPPAGYLREAARLCRASGALLVLDEVQTGFGRTGSMFAFQREDMIPDLLVVAKALGGSVAAISAVLAAPGLIARAADAVDAGARAALGGSGLAGGAFACVAAQETLRIIDDEGLIERGRASGERLREGVSRRLRGHPLVRDVRGRGLLVGIELGGDERLPLGRVAPRLFEAFSRGVLGHWVAVRLLERGVVCQPTIHQPNVLRLEPPLTVSDAEVDGITDAVGNVLDSCRDVSKIAGQIAGRLAKQALGGWAF